MRRFLLSLGLVLGLCATGARADLDPAALKGLASDDFDAKQAAITGLAATGDADAERVLKALADDVLAVAGGRVVLLG